MGPRVRKTQAYEEAILRINEDNEDDETHPQARRGRGKATKP